jgi:single-strand DNA-binding protein
VEGRLKYGKYTDKDGRRKERDRHHRHEMQLLGSRQGMGGGDEGGGGGGYSRPAAAPRQAPAARPAPAPAAAKPASGFDDMDDDIPF